MNNSYTREGTPWWYIGWLFCAIGFLFLFNKSERYETRSLLEQALDALEEKRRSVNSVLQFPHMTHRCPVCHHPRMRYDKLVQACEICEDPAFTFGDVYDR